MDYDCGDHYCFVEHKLVDNCIVYTPDSRPNCSIPCFLDYCDFVIYHEINCPIYHCIPSTTLKPQPTSSIPDPVPDPIEGFNIFSYFLNIFCTIVFFVIGLRILRQFLRKRSESAERTALLEQRQSSNNPFPNVSLTNLSYQDGFEQIDIS